MSELARVTVKAVPDHTQVTRVIARPSNGDELRDWVELKQSLASDRDYELGLGAWELVGFTSEGAISAQAPAVGERGRKSEVLLDFRQALTIKGLVYDGVFAQRLEGAEATIATLNGVILVDDARTSGFVPIRRVAITDSAGQFELRTVSATEGTVLVRCDGFAAAEVKIPAQSVDGVLDLGNIPLPPIESLEVRLVGFGAVDPTSFQIREGWDSEPVAFDTSATAWVELPKAVPDLALNLFAPDGVNLRIDLVGMAMDHNPLEIDLSDQIEVEVAIDDWESHFSARNLNLCVVSIDSAGLQRFSVAELDTERASAWAWGSGSATASIVEVNEDSDVFLTARTVALERPRPALLRLTIGQSAGWQFFDEAGVPLGGALLYAAIGELNRFSMALVADDAGRVAVPIGMEGQYSVNAHLPDGTIQTDLPLRAPIKQGEYERVELSRAEVYEVVLMYAGSPLPWHRVSVCSTASVDLGLLSMSNEDGELGDLRFRVGSRPRLVIHDPRLFEYGQSYPLRPGRNEIEVRRTATLVVEITPPLTAEALVVGDAEFAGWLASGKVRRDVSQVGEVTQVRYSPVPLGEYSCTLAGEVKGPLAVLRAGATSTYSF